MRVGEREGGREGGREEGREEGKEGMSHLLYIQYIILMHAVTFYPLVFLNTSSS